MLHYVNDVFACIVIHVTIVPIIQCCLPRRGLASTQNRELAVEEFAIPFHSELACIGLEF